MWIEFLILLATAIICLYKWGTRKQHYFVGRNVKYEKIFPFVGIFLPVMLKKRSIINVVVDIYKKSGSSSVYGVFENSNPVFMIKDPEVIRQVTIKDFDHFINHKPMIVGASAEEAGLFGNSLFAMHDEKWKDMRSTLSPAFTGKKMRMMLELIGDVSQQAMGHLLKREDCQTGFEIDIKDYFNRFTNDAIASVAFGIKVDSIEDEKNEFYQNGKKLTNFKSWQIIKFLIFMNFKPLAKLLGIEIWDRKQTDFFYRLVLDAMKYRKEHKIIRPDMINMLMEARGMGVDSENETSKSIREWTDTEIVAQCFLFFVAGFESAASLMCFASHELMENPAVQQKLHDEIDNVKKELNGEPLTYEAINGMKYLDTIISETLRKWPTVPFIDRLCNKPFVIENPCGQGDLTINEGEVVWIPVSGLQKDPEYFPNPELFDPDRFNDENKHNIKPFTYMPFGSGPRICIANRFATMEAKVILFNIFNEFKVEASPKSTIPLDLNGGGGFRLVPKNGFWLKLIKRN